MDDQNRLITGLGRDQFQVYEDSKPQKITSFRTERVPVALGILIDNSGSMLPKRTKVNQAALRLVDASQEDDRVFVRTTMTGTHDGEYKGIAPTGRRVAVVLPNGIVGTAARLATKFTRRAPLAFCRP